MHKSCPYLEFLWPTFSHVWTEYRDLLSKYPYSVQMQENIGQTNSKYKYSLGTSKGLLANNSNQEAKKDDHQQVDRSSCKQRVGGSTRKKIDITLEKKNKQTKVQSKKLIKCNREIPKYLYHYRHLSSQNQTRLNMEFPRLHPQFFSISSKLLSSNSFRAFHRENTKKYLLSSKCCAIIYSF